MTTPRAVLIIDDTDLVRRHLQKVLEQHKVFDTFYTAADGMEGFKLLVQNPVQLVLCDLFMPGMDGFKFLTLVRQRVELADTPVIMLTGNEEVRAKVKALEAGAADYLVKPVDDSELVARVRVHLKVKALQDELREKNARLETLNRIDPLTGLVNRRVLLERLEDELVRARRYGIKLTYIMADIDNFKRINDTYGHRVGDMVLARVAQVFSQALRASDVAGRYGGEEFGLVLPETDSDGARVVAERCRSAVENQVFENTDLRVTLSLGVTTFIGETNTGAFIERADQALYLAKHEGKNRVVVAA